MKISFKTPKKFENGEVKSLIISDDLIKVKDLVTISKRGGIDKKSAQAYVFSLFEANDGEFKLTEKDYYEQKGLYFQGVVDNAYKESQLVTVVSMASITQNKNKTVKELYQNAINFDHEKYYALSEGEFIASDPLIEKSVLKLSKPIEVEIDGVKDYIELVTIGERLYGDLEGEITNIFADDILKVRSFISQYLEPYNHPNENVMQNIFQISGTMVDKLSAGDFYRINALLYAPFLQAEASLYDIVEE